MADGSGGVAGNAIESYVQDAVNQLQALIKRSSEQLKRFVADSIAKIDARQKQAEDKLERATQAAEERARAAADDALAAFRAESAEAQRAAQKAYDDALAKMQAEMDAMRAEMEATRSEIGSIQGLKDKTLDIGDIGFDFDGDGQQDDEGTVYEYEDADEPQHYAAPQASAADLEGVAQRVFDRLAAEIEAGRLRTGIARDDSVYLMTKPDFRDFVLDAVRGDERSNELAIRFFWLPLAIEHLANGENGKALDAIKQIETDQNLFDDTVDECVEERMRKFDEARG